MKPHEFGVVKSIDEREAEIVDTIGKLLIAVSGRQPRGNISDVIRRMIDSDDLFITSTQGSRSVEDDIECFVQAVWRVICDNRADREIGISCTIPRVSGTTSQFSFVQQYAQEFLCGPAVGIDTPREKLLLAFEQKAVAAVVYFQTCSDYFDVDWVSTQLKKLAIACQPNLPYEHVASLTIDSLCVVD